MLKKNINLFSILILTYFIFSCQKNDNGLNINSKFRIDGKVDSTYVFEKIYLSYIIGDQMILVDSSKIINKEFILEGRISSPQKAVLHFYENADIFPFILSGEKFNIDIKTSDIENSIVNNSKINKEWENVKNTSKNIFGEVDYYYPIIQKARMQNDFVTLNKLNITIDSLEVVNRNFLKKYILKNNHSTLSVLLMNDLYANPKNDSIELVNLSKKLHPKLQKMLDFDVK